VIELDWNLQTIEVYDKIPGISTKKTGPDYLRIGSLACYRGFQADYVAVALIWCNIPICISTMNLENM